MKEETDERRPIKTSECIQGNLTPKPGGALMYKCKQTAELANTVKFSAS